MPIYDPSYQAGEDEVLIAELQYREIIYTVLDRFQRANPMTTYSLIVYAGNDKEFLIYVKDRNLVPIDLTGATAVMTFKTTKSGSVLFQLSTANPAQGIIAVPTQGEVRFYLVPSNTSSLDIRQYHFDVTITTSSGKKYTVLDAIMNLKEPVNS